MRVVVFDDLIMIKEINFLISSGFMQQLESHAVQRWPLISLPLPGIAHRHGLLDVLQTMHAPVITVGIPAQIHFAIAIQG